MPTIEAYSLQKNVVRLREVFISSVALTSLTLSGHSLGNVSDIVSRPTAGNLPRMKVMVRNAFLARFCDLDFLRLDDF